MTMMNSHGVTYVPDSVVWMGVTATHFLLAETHGNNIIDAVPMEMTIG